LQKKFKSDTITVELDLRKSKNGTIYILHDETVDRTTNGKWKIDQLEDSYINSLFLKKENGQITRERIPTFDDVLMFIKIKNNLSNIFCGKTNSSPYNSLPIYFASLML
jgi:glycerophosphoryl diester phosphodiesterase